MSKIKLEHIGVEIAGKEFNETYPDIRLVKLTNENEIHNGFHFNDGLNVDTKEFTPTGDCVPGGIYFTQIENAYMWINYRFLNSNIMHHMRIVTIPDDARVYIERTKLKADKLILGPKSKINNEIYLNFVKNGGMNLDLIPENLRNKDICMEAVKHNGWALLYVPEIMKDIDICVEAVKVHRSAICFVPIELRENVNTLILENNDKDDKDRI